MTRKFLWLSMAILLGLVLAAVAVAMPAQAAKSQLVANTTDQDPPGEEVFGVVNDFPDELVGSWTVDNVVYTATTDTRFKMEGAPFFVGACVRVIYDPGSYTALLIETESHNQCGENARQHLTGLIDQVPATFTDTLNASSDITATWVISGIEFISTPETEFKTENGPLEVGACASVRYRVVNDINLAEEIRSEKLYRCLESVAFNQAFGYLVTYPPDLMGAWVISDTTGVSLTFMSTPSTVLVVKGTPLQVGACTGVKYYTDEGINYAVFVLIGDSSLCEGHFGSNQPRSKIIATVDARPDGVITGTWTLAGVTFTATEETHIEEEDEPLEIGSCAAAKYDPSNGAMLLHQLEGEEAEDCQAEGGEPRFKLFGVIEMKPTGGFTGTWQVSGVTFQVTSTTELESRHGDFVIGAYVKVFFTYDSTTGERTAQVIKTHVAPGFGWKNFRGRFGGWSFDPQGDKLIVDDKTYNADADIDASAGIQNGDQVWVNAYEDNGVTLVTQVLLAQQVYLPMLRR